MHLNEKIKGVMSNERKKGHCILSGHNACSSTENTLFIYTFCLERKWTTLDLTGMRPHHPPHLWACYSQNVVT
jgi:hypothetical protein